MVDMSKEAVEALVAEALKGFDFGRFLNHAPKIPDTICLNCGRCVMVGKCCDNPNRVIMENKLVSAETWNQIQEIIKNPPEPTKELRELMTGKRRYEIRTK